MLVQLKWFAAIKQQAITWANVDPDLCHHLSPNHNVLTMAGKIS